MFIKLLLSASLLLVILGCEDKQSSQKIKINKKSFFVNKRVYIKNNITCVAKPIKDGKNYEFLEIGTPSTPYNSQPPIAIKFPDGSRVNTATLDFNSLPQQKISRERAIAVCYNSKTKTYQHWPDGSEEIRFGSWLFIIHQNKILFLQVHSWKNDLPLHGCIPAIGSVSSKKMNTFPLAENDIINIFGTPDEIFEDFEE